LSSPPCLYWLWSPNSLVSSGYQCLSLGVKGPHLGAGHSPPPSAEVFKEAINLHGVVLN
jgi:hypothetical protein